jgi:hypothetical protein
MGQTQSTKVSEGINGVSKTTTAQSKITVSSTDLAVTIYDKMIKYLKTLLVADVESLYQPETDLKLKVYFGGKIDNSNIIDISSAMNDFYNRSLILPNAGGGFTPRVVIIDYLIKILNRWVVSNTNLLASYDDVELSYLTDNLAKACISCLFQKDKLDVKENLYTFDPDKSLIQLIDKSVLLALVDKISNTRVYSERSTYKKEAFVKCIFDRLYKFDIMPVMVEINKKIEEAREIVRENIKLPTKTPGEEDTMATINLTIQPSAPSESAVYGGTEEGQPSS